MTNYSMGMGVGHLRTITTITGNNSEKPDYHMEQQKVARSVCIRSLADLHLKHRWCLTVYTARVGDACGSDLHR